ncbi:MAG: glycosyltransferase family 4 protein [Rhodothermales bacterium]|nr:glycosyltransferase family 4 protein [Rhodothermales bacterium]
MSWLPEQPGNGLDRVYHALFENLPHANVQAYGSVAGSRAVAEQSGGMIVAFDSDKASLATRLMKQRLLVRAELKKRNYDLIASHFALYTYPILGLIKPFPLVVHFHGPWADESRVEGEGNKAYNFKKYIERRVYRQADMFIVLSTAFRDVLIEHFGVPAKKIRIVPGGADLDRFDVGGDQLAARNRLGWESDKTIIVSVRRLARRMGLEHLIDSVSTLSAQFPDLRLKIAGKGPIQDELQQRIIDRNAGDVIELLGYVPEELLPSIYSAADLSVVPTVSLEGFGLITVESLASGTPCLVTPVGGLPEVVRDLSADLITSDTTTESLTDSLARILSREISLPDSQMCIAFAREHYDWKAVARKTRKVYDEVLSQ